MKRLLILVVIFVILATTILPLYLGPNDIADCSAPTTSGRCQRVDAIVAVSGGDTLARADEAIKLYEAGWSDLVIFSGAALDKTGPSNASSMRKQAIAAGISADHILVEEESTTTAENARNTARLLEERSLSRIMLVTSAYHQRRASIEFSKYLSEGTAIVNHPVANDNQWSSWWWLTPYGWWLGLGEIAKIIFAGFASL